MSIARYPAECPYCYVFRWLTLTRSRISRRCVAALAGRRLSTEAVRKRVRQGAVRTVLARDILEGCGLSMWTRRKKKAIHALLAANTCGTSIVLVNSSSVFKCWCGELCYRWVGDWSYGGNHKCNRQQRYCEEQHVVAPASDHVKHVHLLPNLSC